MRDPLLTLGCCDPVARISEAKSRDLHRRVAVDAFEAWWQAHQNNPVKSSELDQTVKDILDPQGRGRQFLAVAVDRLVGTRVGGLTLTAQKGEGQWSVTTYAVHRIEADGSNEGQGHRDHRDHRPPGASSEGPMGPMTPMPEDF